MLSVAIVICSLVAAIIDDSLTCTLYLVFTLARCISRPHWAWPIATTVLTALWLAGLIVFAIMPANFDADFYWHLFGYTRQWDWMSVIFLIITLVILVLSACEVTVDAYGKSAYGRPSVDPMNEIGRLKVYAFFSGEFVACVLSPNIFRIPYVILLASIFLLRAFQQPEQLDALFESGLHRLKCEDIRYWRIFLLIHAALHSVTISILRITEISRSLSRETRLFLGVMPNHGVTWSIADWYLFTAISIELALFLLFSPLVRFQFFIGSSNANVPSQSDSNQIPLHPLERAKTDPIPFPKLPQIRSAALRISSSVQLPSRMNTKKILHRRPHSSDIKSPSALHFETTHEEDAKTDSDEIEIRAVPFPSTAEQPKGAKNPSASPEHLVPLSPPIVRASSAPEKLENDSRSSRDSKDARSFSVNVAKLFRRGLRTFEISICIFALTVVFIVHQQLFNVVLMAFVLAGLLMGTSQFSEVALYTLLPFSVSVAVCAFVVFSLPWVFTLSDDTLKLFGLYNDESSTSALSMALFLSPALILWLYCRSSANKRTAARAPLTTPNIINASIEGDEYFLDMALRRDQDLFVKAVDSRGRTALHNAVLHGHLGSVEVVLHRGGLALIDVLDADGRSALELSNQSRITRQLLRYGAQTSERWEEQQARLRADTSNKLDFYAVKEFVLEAWSEFERIVKVALIVYGAKIALLCVFFVGFSRIDLLHIGYVLISLLYVSMPKLSAKREKWLPLTIFSASALLCQYTVSVINPQPEGYMGYIFQSIGLVALNPFFAMFIPPLVATALCLFQLHFIDQRQRSNWGEMSAAWKTTGIRVVLSLSSIFNEAFHNFGSLIACFAFFLISFSEEPTIFDFGYLTLCLTAFMVSSISIVSGRSRHYIFWALAVAYTASVVFLKYAVQYKIVSSLVETIIELLYYPPQPEFRIDINIIGMPIIDTAVDSLFFQLLPAISVFFVTVSFFRIQYFGAQPSRASEFKWSSVLTRIGSRRLAFCASMISKIVALLPIVAFCLHPSVISFIYVLASCICMLRTEGFCFVWLPELILTSVFLLARYLFQIRPVRARWSGARADYIGFNVIQDQLLGTDALRGELLILLFIYIQRAFVMVGSLAEQMEREGFLAQQFNQGPIVSVKNAAGLEERSPSDSCVSLDSSESMKPDATASRFGRTRSILSHTISTVARYVLLQLNSLFDGSFPFRFDIELASIAIFCAIAARRTAASLFIFVVWGSFYNFGKRLQKRFWRVTVLLFLFITILECLAALGPPPTLPYTIPIPDLSKAQKNWLGLTIDYVPNIAFTYVALWLLSMCNFANSCIAAMHPVVVSASELVNEQQSVLVDLPGPKRPSTLGSRILPFCPYFLIGAMFIASSLYADVTHLILLMIAIIVYSTGPFNGKCWSVLRICNYVIFLLLLGYQCPWPGDRTALLSDSVDNDLGLRHIDSAQAALSSSGFLSFLIGFLILDIKRRLDQRSNCERIEAEYVRWRDVGEIRLNLASVLWNNTRIAEFHSMRRVQEELRHQLRCLLTDTRRLGLEKLEDTEVWPSVPPERTVHFTIDKDKRIIEWNPEVSLLTQWNAKDVIGLYAWEIFPRKISSNIKQVIRKCLRSKSFREVQNMDSQRLAFIKKSVQSVAFIFIFTLRRESRLQIDVDAWLTPLTDADGNLVGIVFFMSPVTIGSVFDATLGLGSQTPSANVKRFDSSNEVTDGLIKTDLAAVRTSLENDIIEAYSSAFVDLIDGRENEKSIIGSSLSCHFVNENDRSRLANAIQDMIASGGTIQIKSLLASMQTWTPPVESSPNGQAAVAPTPLVFVAEVSITPVENANDELTGLELCFKRHHVEDVTISYFRSMISFLKQEMVKRTDHLMFSSIDECALLITNSCPNKADANEDINCIKSPKSATGLRFWTALMRFIISHTQTLCVSMFILNLVVNGTLSALFIPLILFLYGLFVRPRVPPSLWALSITYIELVIFLKFVISFFVDPSQSKEHGSGRTVLQETQTLGWTQFSGLINTTGLNFLGFVCLDLFCLFAAAVHLHCLKRKGIDSLHNECEGEFNDDLLPSSPVADDDNHNVNASPSQSKQLDGNELISPKSVNFSEIRRVSSEYSLTSRASQFEDKRIQTAGRVLEILPDRISMFLRNLLGLTSSGMTDTTLKPGKSYYIPSFIVEMITAVFILFGWNSLTASANSNQDQIRSQTFEGAMVGVLFLQIIFIVTDRLCFLYRSLMMKLSLHYIQVLFFTYLMFFSWPKNRQYGFSSNPALVVFFILKCCYWWMSCTQIRCGYPAYTLHHRIIFSKASKTRLYIFKAYRAIPFVAELEVLLDWVSTDTALDLFETFKLEDIYSNLYMIKGDLIYKREHRRGEPFPTITKFTNGTLLFIGLMVVICLPLLLFSTASPVTNQLNNVQRGSMTLFLTPSVNGNTTAVSFTLLDSSSLSIESASSHQVNMLGSVSDTRTVQNIIANGYSDAPWQLSPPSLELFRRTLNDTTALRFSMRFSFVHQDSSVSEISVEKDTEMSNDDKKVMLNMLDRTSSTPVLITGKFIPLCLKLSKVVQPIPFASGEDSYPLSLQLKSDNNVEWWELTRPNGVGKMNVLTISDTITSGLLAAVIAMSLTTIYVTIVLAVGRFLRSMVQNQVYSIIYTDIHDVTDLMLLCEGIFVARKQKEFELEEALYRSLIRLYRSPDSLIQSTKRREKLKLD